MEFYINGETPFKVLSHSFGVQSPSAFTLAYSVDGENYTNYSEQTPANEPLFVTNVPKNCFFKLVGNTEAGKISY